MSLSFPLCSSYAVLSTEPSVKIALLYIYTYSAWHTNRSSFFLFRVARWWKLRQCGLLLVYVHSTVHIKFNACYMHPHMRPHSTFRTLISWRTQKSHSAIHVIGRPATRLAINIYCCRVFSLFARVARSSYSSMCEYRSTLLSWLTAAGTLWQTTIVPSQNQQL